MPHFTVHTAERYLNQKSKVIEDIYSQHDYFDERKEALDKLSQHLKDFFNDPRKKN